jgi:soluble lytic murein transglycosylase-like protein
MSIEAVLARVAEIEQQTAPPGTAATTSSGVATTASTSFSTVLQQQQQPVEGTNLSSGSESQYEALFEEAGQRYNVSPALLAAVAKHESGFDPNAVSPAGAQGLMQLMPATAQGLGVTNPYDPRQSIFAAAKDLGGLISNYNGDISLGLAAYNAGSGAVARYGGIPPYPETQNYVSAVLSTYQEYSSQASGERSIGS